MDELTMQKQLNKIYKENAELQTIMQNQLELVKLPIDTAINKLHHLTPDPDFIAFLQQHPTYLQQKSRHDPANRTPQTFANKKQWYKKYQVLRTNLDFQGLCNSLLKIEDQLKISKTADNLVTNNAAANAYLETLTTCLFSWYQIMELEQTQNSDLSQTNITDQLTILTHILGNDLLPIAKRLYPDRLPQEILNAPYHSKQLHINGSAFNNYASDQPLDQATQDILLANKIQAVHGLIPEIIRKQYANKEATEKGIDQQAKEAFKQQLLNDFQQITELSGSHPQYHSANYQARLLHVSSFLNKATYQLNPSAASIQLTERLLQINNRCLAYLHTLHQYAKDLAYNTGAEETEVAETTSSIIQNTQSLETTENLDQTTDTTKSMDSNYSIDQRINELEQEFKIIRLHLIECRKQCLQQQAQEYDQLLKEDPQTILHRVQQSNPPKSPKPNLSTEVNPTLAIKAQAITATKDANCTTPINRVFLTKQSVSMPTVSAATESLSIPVPTDRAVADGDIAIQRTISHLQNRPQSNYSCFAIPRTSKVYPENLPKTNKGCCNIM